MPGEMYPWNSWMKLKTPLKAGVGDRRCEQASHQQEHQRDDAANPHQVPLVSAGRTWRA